jgi:hypothetical protein
MTFDKINNPNDLLEYMKYNIKYGFLGKNGKKYYDQNSNEWNDWSEQCIVQSGEEVIESKIGTCWDQVELERLWFDKYNYTIRTFFIWFEVGRENDLPTHTFLLFEREGKWYWFENSFAKYSGIHEYNSVDEAIEDIKNKQIDFASYNKDFREEDKNTLECYEFTKPISHLGVDDYIDFVTQKKYNENNKKL